MKRFAYAIIGLVLIASGSGCCGCLSRIFHPYGGGGYGGGCNPCGQVAPYGGGGCPNGACGYGPMGPMGYAAPMGGTAMAPTLAPTASYGNAPVFAAVSNNPVY